MRRFCRIDKLVLVGFVAITFTAALGAQSPPAPPPAKSPTSPPPSGAVQRYRFRVLGVYDDATGEPIEGVEVSDVLSGTSSITSKTGTVSLFFLPDGGSLVRLRKLGYEMQTVTIAITPVDTAPVTMTLVKAVQLATVKVNAKASVYHSVPLKDAEERMNAHNGGYFIDETEMRKHDGSTLANTLVSKVAGILRITGGHGENYFVSSRTPCRTMNGCAKGGPNCFIGVWIDGVPSAVQPPDFSRMSPTDYAIAEFYPGEATVPVEFTGGTGPRCGVLLLWTREK